MPKVDMFPSTISKHLEGELPRSWKLHIPRCGPKVARSCDMRNADCPWKCVKAEPLAILPDLNKNMDKQEAIVMKY